MRLSRSCWDMCGIYTRFQVREIQLVCPARRSIIHYRKLRLFFGANVNMVFSRTGMVLVAPCWVMVGLHNEKSAFTKLDFLD